MFLVDTNIFLKILLGQRKKEEAKKNVEILSLPQESYPELVTLHKKLSLDFDDAYQCAVANVFDLTIVTMDEDFVKALDYVKVLFL